MGLPKAFRNNFVHVFEFSQLIKSDFALVSKNIHYLFIYFLLHILNQVSFNYWLKMIFLVAKLSMITNVRPSVRQLRFGGKLIILK